MLNATIHGNHLMRGYDALKNTLKSLLKYCGNLWEVEPYGGGEGLRKKEAELCLSCGFWLSSFLQNEPGWRRRCSRESEKEGVEQRRGERSAAWVERITGHDVVRMGRFGAA